MSDTDSDDILIERLTPQASARVRLAAHNLVRRANQEVRLRTALGRNWADLDTANTPSDYAAAYPGSTSQQIAIELAVLEVVRRTDREGRNISTLDMAELEHELRGELGHVFDYFLNDAAATTDNSSRCSRTDSNVTHGSAQEVNTIRRAAQGTETTSQRPFSAVQDSPVDHSHTPTAETAARITTALEGIALERSTPRHLRRLESTGSRQSDDVPLLRNLRTGNSGSIFHTPKHSIPRTPGSGDRFVQIDPNSRYDATSSPTPTSSTPTRRTTMDNVRTPPHRRILVFPLDARRDDSSPPPPPPGMPATADDALNTILNPPRPFCSCCSIM